jgi:hypothetical protein
MQNAKSEIMHKTRETSEEYPGTISIQCVTCNVRFSHILEARLEAAQRHETKI